MDLEEEYDFDFSEYQRSFSRPLQTHHGIWRTRSGLILSVWDRQGQLRQGEIAPLPWFGTETLSEAIALCESFGSSVSLRQVQQIADHYPASQFGFESAILGLSSPAFTAVSKERYCQLLARDNTLLAQLSESLAAGLRTFKVKIAIDDPAQEMPLCQAILDRLPDDGKLRLDANGGLALAQAQTWLEWGDRQSTKKLEFIEQPLPPEQFNQMLAFQDLYQTPLALDESVATLKQLQQCYQRGWRGIFVIKAAIAGFPSQLQEFCQLHDLDLVFSTVFETRIGQQAILNLAQRWANPERALGFGGAHWFSE